MQFWYHKMCVVSNTRFALPAGLTHLSPLLGTSWCAAGAAWCGSQQPPTSQQAQPGTRQASGGHLELAKAPPGRHTAPNTASGGERVGLAKATAAGRDKKVKGKNIFVVITMVIRRHLCSLTEVIICLKTN